MTQKDDTLTASIFFSINVKRKLRQFFYGVHIGSEAKNKP